MKKAIINFFLKYKFCAPKFKVLQFITQKISKMLFFWSFQLLPTGDPYNLSSLPSFKKFHVTSCYLSEGHKKGSLYVSLDNQKFLLTTVDKKRRSVLLDLWFHPAQNCQFTVEGEATVTVLGYFSKRKKEKSIMDDDEFKAIAFKAHELGKELEDLHNMNKKKKKGK